MIQDPESAVLVALMRGRRTGMTINELAEVTEASTTTVRNHLRVMEEHRRTLGPWVERLDGRPARFVLTEKGREVARFRARRKW